MRVVVTGLGAITPLGLSVAELWEALLAGRSGVGPITAFDPTGLPTRIAAEVRGFQPLRYLDAKTAGRLERVAQFAVAVGRQALNDAGIVLDQEDRERVGVIMNTGVGAVNAVHDETLALRDSGPRRVSPLFVPMMMPNIVACQVSITLDLRGPVMTATAACASGLQAIVDGLRLLRQGEADLIVAGGTEAAMMPLSLAALSNMHALSRRNDEPERASRPFDRGRDGFVFGEGAGALILETLAHARARGAAIYAEVLGGALTADAHHIAAPQPSGDGASRAIAHTLTDAGRSPEEVDFVCAHATSTPAGDLAEARALHKALGDHVRRVAVTAPKSMLGHLLGAAGAIGGLIAAKAIETGLIPPTMNLEDPDPACDLDIVAGAPRQADVRLALANGFGFGGQNAVVAFGRFGG
ncbi:MAG: beta-ketoacyl-ACP synthase II [Chloroflexi bacterium]|nr:beta-ketoacyl-ACP synthase II [Chloroflexota bacterium]